MNKLIAALVTICFVCFGFSAADKLEEKKTAKAEVVKTEKTEKQIEEKKAENAAIHRIQIVNTNMDAITSMVTHCRGGVIGYATYVSGNGMLIILLMDEKKLKAAEMYRLAEICIAEHFKSNGLKPATYVISIYTTTQYFGRGTFDLKQAYALVQKYKDAKPLSAREMQLLMPVDVSLRFTIEGAEDTRSIEE